MGRLEDVTFKCHTHRDFVEENDVLYHHEDLPEILKAYGEDLLDKVYERIKHGDEEHMKWLKDKCEELKKEL